MIFSLFSKSIKQISESLRRFVVVFAYSIIIFAIFVIYDWMFYQRDSDIVLNIMFGCTIGIIAAVLIRLIEEKRHPDKPGQIIVAVISLIPTIITTGILQLGSDTGKESITICITVGIAIILLCIIMYILASDKHERYIYAWATKSILFSGFAALVIGIGLSICLIAVDNLIVSISENLYEDVWVFVSVVLFINLLCSYIPKKDDELHISQFFKVIMAYVLLPIFLVLTAVLYIYIIKIIVTLHMPSGTMNWFASLALAGWVIFWLTLRYIDNKLIQIYIRWSWILLIPIVIVQIIGVGIRLQAYGLTTSRYISLCCTLLGVIALIVAAVNKRPRIMMIVVAITASIITITPLNIFDAPSIDQYHRFLGLLTKYGKYNSEVGFVEGDNTSIPEDDAQKIYSCYDYLGYNNSDRGYFEYNIDKQIFHSDKFISRHDLYTMLNMEEESYEYSRDNHDFYRDTYLINPDEYIDTTGTTKMRNVYMDFEDGDYSFHTEFSDGTVVDADFTNYADELNAYIKYPTDGDDSQYVEGELKDNLCTMEVDGGRIWIKNVSVMDYQVTDIPSFSISGYYLEY